MWALLTSSMFRERFIELPIAVGQKCVHHDKKNSRGWKWCIDVSMGKPQIFEAGAPPARLHNHKGHIQFGTESSKDVQDSFVKHSSTGEQSAQEAQWESWRGSCGSSLLYYFGLSFFLAWYNFLSLFPGLVKCLSNILNKINILVSPFVIVCVQFACCTVFCTLIFLYCQLAIEGWQ